MENNRLTRLKVLNASSVVTIGGMEIKNQIIGNMDGKGLITTETLIPLFLGYSNGKESLLDFLDGKFYWAMPISRITPFPYDPSTGESIQWETIKKAVKIEMEIRNKELKQ